MSEGLEFLKFIMDRKDSQSANDYMNSVLNGGDIRPPDVSSFYDPDTAVKMRGIYDTAQQKQAGSALDSLMEDYSKIAGPNLRFLADPESRAELKKSGLNIPTDSRNPYIGQGLKNLYGQGQLENDLADTMAGTATADTYSRIGINPAAQAQHNILQTLQTGQEKSRDYAAKENERTNLSEVLAMANKLLKPDMSGPNAGRYPQAETVLSDLGSLIRDYPVSGENANKLNDNAMSIMEKSFQTKPTYTKVGNDTVASFLNTYGLAPKKLETDRGQNIRLNVNAGGGGSGGAGGDVSILARQIAEGRLDPSAISRRGGFQQAVFSEVERISPGFNFTGATGDAKFATNQGNLQSRALISGVEPLYTRLEEAGRKIGNSSIPGFNRVKNWLKEQSGDPDIVGFNNLRDDVIAESERILMNSGVLSDSKYMRAVENVNSAQSYPQLKAAVKQLRLTVRSRMDALDKKPFGTGEKPTFGNSAGVSKQSDPLGIR